MSPAGWSWRRRTAVAASAGLVLGGAFPPLAQGWLAVVAAAMLCLALRGASARAGALAGAAFGAVSFGILLWWISRFGFLAWGALVALMSASTVLFGGTAAFVSARLGRVGRLVGWPLLWAAADLARGHWPFGGFTWGGLGYAQIDRGVGLAVARLAGVVALSGFVLALGALVAEGIDERRLRRGLVAIGLILGSSLLPLGPAGPPAGMLDVAAVQGNVPAGRFTSLGRGRTGPEDPVIIENHLARTRTLRADPPDLIVWPENAFDRDPYLWSSLFEPVASLQRRLGAPLIMPAIMDAGLRFTNSALLVRDGAIAERYDKVHLVPFGEYVPWGWVRSIVPVLRREVPHDGIAGDRLEPFDIGAARVGTLICFESTYPSLARALVREGTGLLVVATNDASFGSSPAAAQHVAMSRMRAVEHGRYLVQAAISGISALVEPDGSVVSRIGLDRSGILRGELPLSDGLTPYARYGGWVEIAMGAGALLTVAVAGARRRLA